jgi:hypothetical protein
MKSKKKVKKVERPAPIQVRLPFDLLEALDEKAVETGLTRHALIVDAADKAYLHVPKPAAPDALVYGWANPADAKVLGTGLGKLAGHIEDNGPVPGDRQMDREASRADKLAMLKMAIVKVLDQLGASANLSSEQVHFVESAARQFIIETKRRGGQDPSAYSQRSDLAVMAELARCVWVKAAFDKPKE